MSQNNATRLETDGQRIQKLVPAGDTSSGRFEVSEHSDAVGTRTAASEDTVSGRVLAAIPTAVAEMSGSFERFTWQILEEAGAGPVNEHDWYAQETVLAVFAHLEATAGEQVVERVGRFLPELVDWPADATGVTEALETMDDWYRAVHRDDATITFTPTGSSGGELRLATPYPSDFEAGLVRGVVFRFAADGTQVRTTATRDDGVTVYEMSIRTRAA